MYQMFHALSSTNISFEAKGIIAFIISHSEKELEHLDELQLLHMGATTRAIRELEELGYIESW